ncbi:hypothetical protein AYL99_06885 [Fonsecaea erecta]|uniref:Xylanolytic transcriptional activator regulatory domain-containing protein n=1 Tax=Fonsecaea erecta TaxID=1367422 RepID=A0A178ZIH4_9EURO|nr:hypothetical protein AYL99_06885 [Fonsecaea erecta]OAP59587.1 hypothetical protein AYL99_06885 [Fonsecaea erecta]
MRGVNRDNVSVSGRKVRKEHETRCPPTGPASFDRTPNTPLVSSLPTNSAFANPEEARETPRGNRGDGSQPSPALSQIQIHRSVDRSSAAGRTDYSTAFIKPVSCDLSEEDWRHLEAKGVFCLPPKSLESLIICRYAEFVYHLAPVVSLPDLILSVTGGSSGRLSLTLYHAIMCAGSAALEGEHFSAYGYPSKAAARREYYTKSKLLLDLGAEPDRLIACQASLLLMSWSSREDSKDPMYWVGSAINHAFALRLQEEQSNTVGQRKSDNHRLRRRIWWTIVVRECDVAMNLARPPRLRPREPHLLNHDDFVDELDLSGINFGTLVGIKMFLADFSLQRQLERACIERAKLAVRIYDILHRTSEEVFQSSSDLAGRKSRISELENSLRDWSSHLPEELRLENICSVSFDLCHRAYHLASCMVHLTYWMAIIVLHSTEISEHRWATCSHNSENHELEGNEKRVDCHVYALRQASNRITTIYGGLNSRKLTQFVPVTGIASVCSAAFVYLLDASSGHSSLEKSSLESLAICIEAVRQIGRINFTATAVFKRVEAAYSAAQKASFPPWLKTKRPGPEFVTSTIDDNDAVTTTANNTSDGPSLSVANICSSSAAQEQQGAHAGLLASTQDFFTLFESNLLFEDSLLFFDSEDHAMREAIPVAESEDGNLDNMAWSMGLTMGPDVGGGGS